MQPANLQLLRDKLIPNRVCKCSQAVSVGSYDNWPKAHGGVSYHNCTFLLLKKYMTKTSILSWSINCFTQRTHLWHEIRFMFWAQTGTLRFKNNPCELSVCLQSHPLIWWVKQQVCYCSCIVLIACWHIHCSNVASPRPAQMLLDFPSEVQLQTEMYECF